MEPDPQVSPEERPWSWAAGESRGRVESFASGCPLATAQCNGHCLCDSAFHCSGGGPRSLRSFSVDPPGLHLNYIFLIDKSICVFVYHLAWGREEIEILFSVSQWYASIHWASIPLVKLMVVSTSLPMEGGGVGRWAGIASAQDSWSLQRHTHTHTHTQSPLLRPEPRIISLVAKFQNERNQTLSLKNNVISHVFLQIIIFCNCYNSHLLLHVQCHSAVSSLSHHDFLWSVGLNYEYSFHNFPRGI